MRRSIIILIAPLLLWTTWGRSPRLPQPTRVPLIDAIVPIALPPVSVTSRYLGPLQLEGAWQIRSRHPRVFGYSALTAEPTGRLLALNDSGEILSFIPPPAKQPEARNIKLRFRPRPGAHWVRDTESTTVDPATGTRWAGIEGSNMIVRFSSQLRETGVAAPAAMRDWGRNTGAEAMARLADGRFVTIREIPPSIAESRLHDAVLFEGDPVQHPDGRRFQFDGPDNFSVVDMAMMPDGRALILMRRLLWPLPMRFAGRIVIADTARIRAGQVWHSAPLASLASTLPVDNFEAIAAVPAQDGRLTVWIMSDDNKMRILQRTLLWKLSVDPAKLPWPK